MLNLLSVHAPKEIDDWASHPYTQYVLRQIARELRPRALDELCAVCRKTTDPQVAKKMAELDALEEVHRFFRLTVRENDDLDLGGPGMGEIR